jgi:hypothetical protein
MNLCDEHLPAPSDDGLFPTEAAPTGVSQHAGRKSLKFRTKDRSSTSHASGWASLLLAAGRVEMILGVTLQFVR